MLGVRRFRALQTLRRKLKGPCDHQRNGKSNYDRKNNQPHRPIWDVEERENLRGDLNE